MNKVRLHGVIKGYAGDQLHPKRKDEFWLETPAFQMGDWAVQKQLITVIIASDGAVVGGYIGVGMKATVSGCIVEQVEDWVPDEVDDDGFRVLANRVLCSGERIGPKPPITNAPDGKWKEAGKAQEDD